MKERLQSEKPAGHQGVLAGWVLGVVCLGLWGYALTYAVSEVNQGEVYRILYLHVPSAMACFFCALILCTASLLALWGRPHWDAFGKAAAEVGLLFTIITLVTGSIWGKPTWGVWWTWDPRLTTTFILALLYVGYLLLWAALPATQASRQACAVLGIIIFADIPIIYKSVTWWRTLHQPPSVLASGGTTMAAEILGLLLVCVAAVLALALWMVSQRAKNLRMAQDIEEVLLEKIAEV